MRVCVKAIRQKWELTATHFIDDLLFLHENKQYLLQSMPEIVQFLESLGWVLNLEKSNLVPSRRFLYRGWLWDTTVPAVSLSHDQVRACLHALRQLEVPLLFGSTTTARALAKTIGKLSATRFQHRQASIHLRSIDAIKLSAIAAAGWDGQVKLPSPPPTALTEDIAWWRQTLTANEPRRIAQTPPQAIVGTDASPIGWGAQVVMHDTGMELLMFGRWRRKASSNSLECAAVERALRTLKQTAAGKNLTSVVVRSDNTATCYNINRQNACDTLLPNLQRLLRFLDRSGWK
jgi:hypothetical protein